MILFPSLNDITFLHTTAFSLVRPVDAVLTRVAEAAFVETHSEVALELVFVTLTIALVIEWRLCKFQHHFILFLKEG